MSIIAGCRHHATLEISPATGKSVGEEMGEKEGHSLSIVLCTPPCVCHPPQPSRGILMDDAALLRGVKGEEGEEEGEDAAPPPPSSAALPRLFSPAPTSVAVKVKIKVSTRPLVLTKAMGWDGMGEAIPSLCKLESMKSRPVMPCWVQGGGSAPRRVGWFCGSGRWGQHHKERIHSGGCRQHLQSLVCEVEKRIGRKGQREQTT